MKEARNVERVRDQSGKTLGYRWDEVETRVVYSLNPPPNEPQEQPR